VLMLEHAIYSVISPEGCASILWRSGAHAADAAEAMKVTAGDLLKLGVIHRIVYEPKGGAHRDVPETIKRLALALRNELDALSAMSADELRHEREEFFLRLGA
jgi:acetyl-CoA carboxylase carboxyl transferase subunit alpha